MDVVKLKSSPYHKSSQVTCCGLITILLNKMKNYLNPALVVEPVLLWRYQMKRERKEDILIKTGTKMRGREK